MSEIDATRAVVETGESYEGKIVPTEQIEIDRPVSIHDDATVEGSVYGSEVDLNGGTVSGSIMAAEEVAFEGGLVDGEVGTPGKVTGSDVTVYGTVTGERVRLQKAFVCGNVVGSEVILEDCFVVGIVAADRKLVLEETLSYSFKAAGETVLDEAAMVLPQAIIEGDVTFESPVVVTGLGKLETASDDLPTMDEADIVEVDGTTHMTLSPRILHLEAVRDRLEELEETLSEVVGATRGTRRPDPTDFLEVLGVDESQYPGVV